MVTHFYSRMFVFLLALITFIARELYTGFRQVLQSRAEPNSEFNT